MKCFIHINDEAISVCKQCGKAMCMNCSAYSDHSGICPECRREGFIAECGNLNRLLNSNKNSIILNIVFAVLLVILSIVTSVLVGIYMLALLVVSVALAIRVVFLFNKRKPWQQRVNYLSAEISKLTNILKHRGTAVI
ncbi:MAG: hypothetical protein HFJ81_02615 [Clostridia bacterium]|nr:hypothetical protein [Clostridia bacterium]